MPKDQKEFVPKGELGYNPERYKRPYTVITLADKENILSHEKKATSITTSSRPSTEYWARE